MVRCVSSKIIHNVGDDLFEPPQIDLSPDGSSVTLHVRLCEWSIVNMTRYCYCIDSVNDNSCSVPGPTLIMHDYITINA